MDPKHLRNIFNSGNVHGIMNTSGLLQSKWFALHVNFARDQIQNWIYYLYLHFIINI